MQVQRPPADPPGPKGITIVRAVRAWRDPLGILQGMVSRYGDVTLIKVGKRRIYLINDPAIIREVLVDKADSFTRSSLTPATERLIGGSIFVLGGKEHARRKRAAMPLFGHERVEFVARISVTMTQEAVARWPRGVPFEMSKEMLALSLRTSAANLFSATDQADVERMGESLQGAIGAFERALNPLAIVLDRLPVGATRRIRDSTKELTGWVDAHVSQRLANPGAAGDLLDMLAGIRFNDGGPDRMTPRELRAEAIDLLVAGYATIAAALGWTLYELASNPSEQQRLAAHLQERLKGSPPSVANLKDIPMARAALMEGLRLHPPAFAVGRRVLSPVKLGPWMVPEGATVMVSPYVTQRDPRFFEDAGRYDISRFEGNPGARQPFTYFPFGIGPRSCLGEGIATAQGTIMLAALIQALEFKVVPDKPAQQRAIGIQPVGKAPMIVTDRAAQAA